MSEPISVPLYKVVFHGEITGEFDLDTSRQQFAKLFKLSPAKTARLFSGRTFTIKNNVTEEIAMQFAVALAEAGCESTIEPVTDLSETMPANLGFPDRRRGVRRIWIRRAPGSSRDASDRRHQPGRRQFDAMMSRTGS